MVIAAAGIVIIPHAPLGLITTSVQALAGILLPSATVFLLLLCNDKEVLGPWINKLWLNIVASVIVSILLMMSLVLMVTTLFSTINVSKLAIALGAALVVAYAIGGVVVFRTRSRRMPSISLLSRPKWSRGRLFGMYLLRGYLVVAVIMLIVKGLQLGFHK
jgi:hypothetical protein